MEDKISYKSLSVQEVSLLRETMKVIDLRQLRNSHNPKIKLRNLA